MSKRSKAVIAADEYSEAQEQDADTALAETPMSNSGEAAAAEVARTVAHTNGDAPPQEKEAKDAKFFRLAVKRVPAAIKRLRHVANLANKNQYEYTPAHAQKIIDTLRAELKALENAFTGTKAPVEAWTL